MTSREPAVAAKLAVEASFTVPLRSDFLRSYLHEAPVALAIERSIECEILSGLDFHRPVLDIGCGDGIMAKVLFAEPLDLGVDINGREIEAAQRAGSYHELLCVPGDAIPRPAGSFLTIMSNSVLEHIEQIEPVLREARRLLAPSGRCFFTVPSQLFERYNVVHETLLRLGLCAQADRWRAGFNRFWRHYHAYDRTTWSALFERCGFTVTRIQDYCPRHVCLLDDALVPAAGWSFVCKKLLNRWFLSRAIRGLFVPLLHALFSPVVHVDPALRDGGILFFELAPAYAAGVRS